MQKRSSWPRIRKFFNDVHLWLGLSSGLIVIAVCFSGTVYVWNTELTEASASHLYKVKAPLGQTRIPADSLFQKIKDSSKASITSVMIPESADRTYQFSTKKEGSSGRGVTYFVNPYTGDITGTSLEKNGTKEFMSTMFSLHRWLLLDKIDKRELGSAITGWATIIFTLGCITGLIIWFPQKLKAWKQGLKIKFSGNWKRTNHDLHNTLAFYSLFFLLLMGLTGPQWSFDWYRTGMQKTLGTYKPKEAAKPGDAKKGKEKQDSSAAPSLLAMQTYIGAADKALPYAGDYTITLPADNAGTLMISKNKCGFFAPAAADRLTLDVASGSVKKKDVFRDKPFNERVAGSIKAIHVGNVYGTFTKIIYFLACLVATSLPITGTLIWWNKLKKKRKKQKPLAAMKEELIPA
ncbi:MAG: PepSY-associated TM helix domain-containing protein [Chitinophagaceae bacterium]